MHERKTDVLVIFFICRGNPIVQGNCLSALAGLAAAVSNYVAGLDPEILRSNETLTEHLKQPHWFTMVAETLLTVIDAGYQSKGRIFAICTQVGCIEITKKSNMTLYNLSLILYLLYVRLVTSAQQSIVITGQLQSLDCNFK